MKKKNTIISVLLILILFLENSDIANASITRTNYFFLHDYTTSAKEQVELIQNGIYTMKYQLDGGQNSWLNVLSYTANQLPIQLHAPAKKGFQFEGWYKDKNYTQPIDTISSQDTGLVLLYAKWSRRFSNETSVDKYAYKTTFLSGSSSTTLNRLNYRFLKKVNIPGMPDSTASNNIKKQIEDNSQIPQGITFTEDYILITAYSSKNRTTPGSLYVFNRENSKYLTTIKLKAGSHLGGIAYDGTNVWICHSENWTLEKIPFYYIEKAVHLNISTNVDVSSGSSYYKIGNRPSCVTYYKGKLYVATQSSIFNSVMVAYKFDGKKLVKKNKYTIPKNVQGVTFNDESEVFLSTSYGRTKSSYLKVYRSLDSMNRNPKKFKLRVEMPPCSEEIAVYGDDLFILFESAGAKYFTGTDGNGISKSPIDKILSLEINSL